MRDQLSQLVRDSAYSLRDDASRPLQGMANEFLGRIIPSFEPASK